LYTCCQTITAFSLKTSLGKILKKSFRNENATRGWNSAAPDFPNQAGFCIDAFLQGNDLLRVVSK